MKRNLSKAQFFEHVVRGVGYATTPGSIHGMAYHDQDPVAEVTVHPPVAYLDSDLHRLGSYDEDESGQRAFPIRDQPAKVGWAVANQKGRAMAAPHTLLALIAQRHNLTLHADTELSQAGSRMSRQAAKRGLIRPHPGNPEMKPTFSRSFAFDQPENIERATNDHLEYQRRALEDVGEREFEPHEVTQAHNAIFRNRRRRANGQGWPWSGVQQKLF
jgi:hypothetical protein